MSEAVRQPAKPRDFAGLCAIVAVLACGQGCDGSPRALASAQSAEVRPASSSAEPAPEPRASAAARPPAAPLKVEVKDSAMGTSLHFIAYTSAGTDEPAIRQAIELATLEMRRLEGLMSEWRDDSEIGRLNSHSGEFVSVSPETLDVIQRGLEAGKLSKGTFDITFQSLSEVWKFGSAAEASPKVPTRAAIELRRKLVDYSKVELDLERRAVRLHKGQKLGLGGVAQGSFFASIELTDHAFSTAGDYARSYVVNGKRYHHILDPRTGYPATACRSVTVWAPDATTADIVDDAVFILGPEQGLEIVAGLPEVGAVIVDKDNKVWISERLRGKVQILREPSDGI
jgi:thiamine biosynthesis lipoprotein